MIRRTSVLSAVLIALLASSVADTEEKTTYPPYPDVWGYELPWHARSRGFIGLHLYDQPDGDVLVGYMMGLGGPQRNFVFHGLRFFSGRPARYSASQFNALEHTYRRIAPPTRARFSDGSVLSPWSDCTGNCCPVYSSRYLRKTSSRGYDLFRKSIFLITDRPIRVNVGRYCDHNQTLGVDEIESRILVVDPVLKLLDDDTVLLATGEHNVVIRLTANLESKSPLSGRRLVLIDHHVVTDELAVNPANGYLRNDKQTADAIEAYISKLGITGR